MAVQKRKKVTKVAEKLAQQDNSDSESLVQAVESKKVKWEAKPEAAETNADELDEPSNAEEKVCLAASSSYGSIGCAFYDPLKCIIFILEDMKETKHFDLTKMLLEQANPDIILTSSKAEDDFIDTLRDYMDAAGGIFQIRPHKEFTVSKGLNLLLSLPRLSDLPLEHECKADSSDIGSNVSNPKNAYDFMRKRQEVSGDPLMKRWNASIRLGNFASLESSPLCTSSIGALIDHLIRERALGDIEDNEINDLEVRDIEIVALDQVMQINADALLSLQVFENESHASVHSDKTKEGLSLFGTFNYTKTTLGRSLLRSWLLRPSLSLSVINARHDAVACFLRSENMSTATAMHGHLKGVKNVPRMLGVLKAGRAKLSDWQGLVKFTFHSTMLRETLSELYQANEVEIIRKLIDVLDITTFKKVGSRVNEIIDWEESSNAGRICVRPHVDEELDNKKHVYHGIDDVLSTVAEQLSETVPIEFASSLNVVYFPQLGYLICVPMLDAWRSDAGIQEIDGWSFQFSSDAHVYFKSQEMRDMDIHIGDLHSAIVDREIEIVQELLEEVLVYDQIMSRACDVCAELDCLLSFAEASRMYDYRRPEMIEDNIIDIYQGRHPLQEQVIDIFVPNDARLSGGAELGKSEHDERWNNILLCTGANACGKSVYLKQIALIQFMAQIGCFVPAESATLGIVDKIFTRVSTRESVSKAQSAFMIDLNQVSLALRNCTARSLIILDEFGKGTLATDGAGLLCGVLKYLLALGADCPKVLVATHFHNIFHEDLLDPEAVPISFRHMQIIFTSSDGTHLSETGDRLNSTRRIASGETITYLYRVAEGLSLESHAAKCAEIFGIPKRIVERAQYVSYLLSIHELERLLDEEMTDEEIADLEDAEEVCRRFLAWDIDEDMRKDAVDVKAKLAEVLGRMPID